MPEPTVPSLSAQILERKPKLSGACPLRSLALMFGAGLPLAVVAGVVAHYLGILVGWLGGLIAVLPNLLLGKLGFIACGVVVFGVVTTAVVMFGYPLVAGVGLGTLVGWLGKQGKCRNTTASGWAGTFSGILAYASHAVIALLSFGELHIFTASIGRLANLFSIPIVGTPWWVYVLVVIDAVLFVAASGLSALHTLEESTFCEEHDVWYGRWRKVRLSVEVAEPLAQTLEAGSIQGLEPAFHLTDKDFPRLLVQVRRCPADSSCKVEVAGKVIWQEKKVNRKGKESTQDHTRTWFDTMVSADLGDAIEKTLIDTQGPPPTAATDAEA